MAQGFYRDRDGKVRPITPRGSKMRVHRSRYPSSGIVHEGSLTKHHYNLEEGEDKRHEALDRAVKDYGYQKTVQKVNALAVLNKNHRENHAKLESDLEYLKRKHGS